jgi:hypothetical protein
MRIRSIKPEFWRSADITGLSLEDRLLFIGLWSYVDDNGVGRDELPVIVADLFAGDMFADSRETVARVSRGLSNLFSASLIDRYSVDGKAYLMICKWDKHQRIDKPAKERFPRSDGTSEVIRDTFATPSRDRRDTLAPGTEEQGSRGTEEQGAGEVVAIRADVQMLCDLLADLIERNGSKRPTVSKAWIDEARRMLDLDGREPEKAARLIRWSQDDEFWRANILSMSKFRAKYDQLRLAAEQKRTGYVSNMDKNLAYLASLQEEEQRGRVLQIEGVA